MLHTCVTITMAVLSVAGLTRGFVRYTLLSNVSEPQWKSNQICLDAGTEGLAVIDTSAKWQSVTTLLSNANHPTSTGVWIGLEYLVSENKPQWRGNEAPYLWAAWDTNEPNWSKSKVIIIHNGSGYAWRTEGNNYEHVILCETNFNSVKMSKHPNDKVNLHSASALLSTWAVTSEDCAMSCASIQSCSYLTYDTSTKTCAMYDSAVTSLLGTSLPSANSWSLYTVLIG